MYEEFFELRERPFDLTPNPRFLFMSPGHREALSTLEYGIAGRKGITVLLGPAGTGKSTLVYAALERQHGEEPAVIVLSNPTLSRQEFTEFLSLELGLSEAAARSKTRFLREIDLVLRERSAAGMATALIVDEAQAMPDELLEEVRLLANMETSTDKLFPVILVGQLELAQRLNALPQLKQRVALRATLAALTAHETASYIAERIRLAGGDVRTVFTPEAVAAICESSRGIPRIISVMCDNALVGGFATDQRPVGAAIVAEVCRDFDWPLPGARAASTEAFVSAAVALTRPEVVAQGAAIPAAAGAAPAAVAVLPVEVPVQQAAAPVVVPVEAAVATVTRPVVALPSVLSIPDADPLVDVRSPAFVAMPAQRDLEAHQEAVPVTGWRRVRRFFGKSGAH